MQKSDSMKHGATASQIEELENGKRGGTSTRREHAVLRQAAAGAAGCGRGSKKKEQTKQCAAGAAAV